MLSSDIATFLGGKESDDPADLIDELLLVSFGRPWQMAFPGLSERMVAASAGQLLITGRVGDLEVRVQLSPDRDRLAMIIDWENRGNDEIVDLVVGLGLTADAGARVTMPQVIHHDNPSADPELTIPHVGRGGFVTQAHRLPIPAVAAERAGRTLILTAVPGDDVDLEGTSLGAIANASETMIIGASGVIMFDGAPDVDYWHKAKITERSTGYRRLQPGEVLRQRWLIVRTGGSETGRGFRELVRLADDLFPQPSDPEPRAHRQAQDTASTGSAIAKPVSRSEAIGHKTADLDARWYADGQVAGYLKFPSWGEPRNRPGRPDHDFLYGWTGQCLRLAWCDARLGLRNAEPWRLDRCRQVVDFYLDGSGTGTPGLRWNLYVHDDRRWSGFTREGAAMVSARAHGETLVDLADIIELFRASGETVPDHWRRAVTEGAEFVINSRLPSGIVPIGWRFDGEPLDSRMGFGGVPAAQAVARADQLASDDHFAAAAIDLAEAYHRLPGPNFDRPYAFSTLDAGCEDKESGMSYLRLMSALFELTGKRQYLDRAAFVADWLLTWVYHWSPRFEPGSMLDEAGFRARGWPGVSVQNHHLDVFFPTHDLWRLGRLTGQDRFCAWAIEIDAALRQGICTSPGEWGFDVVGEQTEAFFVTDWQHRGTANTWNPSWVIADPLWQALLLEADDVLDPIG